MSANGNNFFRKVKALFLFSIIEEMDDLILTVYKPLFVNSAKGIGKQILFYIILTY